MRLAFCLFKYFPFGGLQRDFLNIAKFCQARGATIDVFTMDWQGDEPNGFKIHIIQSAFQRNYKNYEYFYSSIKSKLKNYDKVIGFNKLPGLDYYFAADPCFLRKKKGLKSIAAIFLGRYRHFLRTEERVFQVGSKTQIFVLTETEAEAYQAQYNTEKERFHVLPPAIAKDRVFPHDFAAVRKALRGELGLRDNDRLLLMVGSGFRVKGLDRALRGIAALPDKLLKRIRFVVIGQDNPKSFLRFAKRLAVHDHVTIFQGRSDIPRFLQAADLLLHPAYRETAGMILLEAIINGLPVLTTDTCGYAYHVSAANAGTVLQSPYRQKDLNAALISMLLSDKNSSWRTNGLAYAQKADIYDGSEHAAKIIMGNPA